MSHASNLGVGNSLSAQAVFVALPPTSMSHYAFVTDH